MATNASGFFKAGYSSEFGFWETPWRRFWVLAGLALAAAFPFFAPTFWIGVVNLAAIAAIGALALNLVTGYTGQLSLGHSGFLAAGAFTVGILVGQWSMPVCVTLPAAIVIGMGVGVFVGVPALRLRGIYLSISTLAAYFVIASLASEYQSRFGGGAGFVIPPPQIGSWVLSGERNWYFVLLALVALATLLCLNLNRSHVGRAWLAIRERDLAASAMGIDVSFYKVMAFVISTAMTSLAGALLAYYTAFVSAEAFTFMVTIEYLAMILIGGLGSVLGSLLGALFVTLLPFLVERAVEQLPFPATFKTHMFAVQSGLFAILMLAFLMFEPLGLARIWGRIRAYFELWPFRYRPLP
jgi:branched-chain amino acid transport system permease protein